MELMSTTAPVVGPRGFIPGFVASLSMILVSELGDKTFFIAAVMAMRHPRLIVFAGAMTALTFMTILSALFGFVTTVIPRIYTYYISTALFGIFGFKMLYDGFGMSEDEGQEEFNEVHANLTRRDSDDEQHPLNNRSSELRSSVNVNNPTEPRKLPSSARRILFSLFSRAFLQALSLTFLAEWGDRSQLATIVLAATENLFGVIAGGVLGHSVCTGLAVLGGRLVAQKISVRTVTIIGGCVFLIFAITSLFMNPNK